MNDKKHVFIDTNILIYRSFGSTSQKDLIQNILAENQNFVFISVQVLNEFINTTVKKKLFKSEALLDETLAYFIANFHVASISANTTIKANSIRKRYKIAHYDSVIAAAALESNCSILYSEDMQHHLVIEKKLKLVNPFK